MKSADSPRTKDHGAVGADVLVKDAVKWNFDWLVEKWSQEAVDFATDKLQRDGITHIQDGVELRNGVIIARMIPVEVGLTSDFLRKVVGEPEEVIEVHGNLLLNAGIQRLEDLLIGAGGTAFNNTNTRLGVGDSTTAEAATQTDLQAIAGSTHRQFKLMNASFPVRPGSNGNQSVDFRSDFTSGEANFAWQEWGVDNGNANGTTVTAPMLNRKVQSLGTKTTGTWTLTGTLTIS